MLRYRTDKYQLVNSVTRNNTYYAIQSEAEANLYYVLAKDEIALLRGNDAWRMTEEEFKRLMPYAEREELEDEMRQVLNDWQDMVRMPMKFTFEREEER